MAIKNREDLKAYFTNNTIPSEKQFADLIDSLLNKRDDQFYGKWKAGISYNKGDVVIYEKMLWILTLTGEPDAVDHCSAKGPIAEGEGVWEQLILMVDDADWQVVEDTDVMYAKVYGKVGIGTQDPVAKLDITDGVKGQFLFSPDSHEDPSFSIINLDPKCRTNYLISSVGEDHAAWVSDAPLGFAFKKGGTNMVNDNETNPNQGEILMVIQENEKGKTAVGIGTDQPKAMLDMTDGEKGRFQFSPEGKADPLFGMFNLDEGSDINYLITQVGAENVMWISDAPNGYMLRKGTEYDPDDPEQQVDPGQLILLVRINEHGQPQVGLGVEDPHALLTVSDGHHTTIELGPENSEGIAAPQIRILSLKDGEAEAFLSSEAGKDFARWLTNAKQGFEWHIEPGEAGENSTLIMVAKQSRDHKPRVGIGTDQPAAMLDIQDRETGRFIFAAENFNDPAFIIFDKDSDGKRNYLINSLGKNEVVWGSDAPNGFVFLKNEEISPLIGKDINKDEFLMIIRQHHGENGQSKHAQVGIGETDPHALLEISDSANTRIELGEEAEDGTPQAIINLVNLNEGEDNGFIQSKVSEQLATWLADTQDGFEWRLLPAPEGEDSSFVMIVKQSRDHKPRVGIGTENPAAMLDIEDRETGRFIFAAENFNDPAFIIFDKDSDGKRNYLINSLGKNEVVWGSDAPNGFVFLKNEEISPLIGQDINKDEFLMIIRQHHGEDGKSKHAQAGIGEKDPHALLEISDSATTRIELGEEAEDGRPQAIINLVNLNKGEDNGFIQTKVSQELTTWLTDTQDGFEWRMLPTSEGEDSTFIMIAKQSSTHKPRVGIGTENPAAMLDIRDDETGRFVFAPENFNDPAFVIFDKDSQGGSNYLINSLGKDEVLWGSDAPNGFMFLKNKEFSPMKGKDVNKDQFLMIIPQNAADKEPQVGIGSKDPRAMLDVSDGIKGQLLFSPHDKKDPALSIINLDARDMPTYLTSGVGEREATLITDAPRGFHFKTGEEFGSDESEINLNQGKHMMVIVPDNGQGDGNPKVGIGTVEPLAKLDITNGESGQFLFNLDRKVNPSMSIINLRPGSKRNYLATGVGNKHAVMVTDAPFGFMFKRGDDSEKTPGPDTEVDINQGEILMSVLPDAKVGIGRIPSDYQMDVHGQVRSFNMYLNTDEARTNEIGLLGSVIDNVKKLRPVRFNWQRETGLQNEGEQFGLISHEVDDVFPQVVKIDSRDATSAVSYQSLVPVLVKAVQEQQDMIEKQAAQIEEMREMLEKLLNQK